MKFALILCTCLVITAVCGYLFAGAMAATYPEGIYVYPPPEGREPVPSDAWFIGMAIGTFFCTLIYAAMACSAFLLNRIRSTPVQDLTPPLTIAFVVSAAGFGLSLYLAG